MNLLRAVALILAFALTAPPVLAEEPPSLRNYAPLVGDWELRSGVSQSLVAVETFRWGPNQSYIWQATSLAIQGREVPHFEGLMV